jgi:uncharacterized low-complexity protein
MNKQNKTIKLVSLLSIALIAGAISILSLNAEDVKTTDNNDLALNSSSMSIDTYTSMEGKCDDEKKDAKTDKTAKKEGEVKADHKCGEGKCGTDTKDAKATKTAKADSKCGEGKCGTDTKTAKDAKADAKDKDGKCK